MAAEQQFEDLLRRVQQGDPGAEEVFFRRYESVIRRVARLRLLHSRLRRLLESSDIIQSVLMSFFARLARGEYALDREEQVRHLLEEMARHKVIDLQRKQHAARRTSARERSAPAGENLVDPQAGSPLQNLVAHELAQECWQRLSPAERLLVELRLEGRTWEEIAQEMEGHPEALRKRHARALARLKQQCSQQESDRA